MLNAKCKMHIYSLTFLGGDTEPLHHLPQPPVVLSPDDIPPPFLWLTEIYLTNAFQSTSEAHACNQNSKNCKIIEYHNR